MRLIHYSDKALHEIYSVEQIDLYHFKPTGLWVSVEGQDDWPSWCAGESFYCGPIATEIYLKQNANVLQITDAAGIDRLSAEFSIPNKSYHSINWRFVAKKYHGIIIAPYCWERRSTGHSLWYYTWDCASGCIWNVDAVECFRPIEEDKHG